MIWSGNFTIFNLQRDGGDRPACTWRRRDKRDARDNWQPIRRGPMKLDGLPLGAVDWTQIPAVGHAGETGTATARTRDFGGVQLRVVQYGAGYRADHWCKKGHIVHVL